MMKLNQYRPEIWPKIASPKLTNRKLSTSVASSLTNMSFKIEKNVDSLKGRRSTRKLSL